MKVSLPAPVEKEEPLSTPEVRETVSASPGTPLLVIVVTLAAIPAVVEAVSLSIPDK